MSVRYIDDFVETSKNGFNAALDDAFAGNFKNIFSPALDAVLAADLLIVLVIAVCAADSTTSLVTALTIVPVTAWPGTVPPVKTHQSQPLFDLNILIVHVTAKLTAT